YRGSYETVKRFVRPLRAAEQATERATVRFETPPGQQSQIDWGQAQIHFRHRPVILHVFILTLGYSRRSFHDPCLGATLSQFLPGRTFVDEQDLREQLDQWQREIADARIHGTTHERPTDRFAREQSALVATAGQPGFRLEASQPRRVAEDYLVSFETNRYSVPFTLIGQTVEVTRRAGQLHITHRGTLVAEHEEVRGKYQVRVRPEHGPGAIARTARRAMSSLPSERPRAAVPEGESRDLAIYEALGAPAVTA